MATELTVDAVKDFIALNDGKVKNNVLVAHFKKFLNDAEKKSDSRQKFKDCVNAVAVVKNENGEKYVQLKKKYRTAAPVSAMLAESSTEPEGQDSAQSSPSHISSFDNPIMPENGRNNRHGSNSERLSHTEVVEDEDGNISLLSFGPPITIPPPEQVDPIISTPMNQGVSQGQSIAKQQHVAISNESRPDTSVKQKQVVNDENRSGAGTQQLPSKMDPSGVFRVPVPPSGRKSSNADMPSSSKTSQIPQGAVDQAKLNFQGGDDNTSIMQSEASVDSKENDFEDERGGSNFAMDPLEKQWMLMSAKGNMLELRKLLNKDPNLAEKRDFVLGYTALHWACRKGDIDLVKMLGDTGMDVNVRSNGGYTPMHLAAMHDHEKIVQILVEEFEADGNIRNYSGKLPRDYLNSISLPIRELLFGNDGHGSVKSFTAGLRPRLDSVRKSKRLGNAISGGVGVLGALVRGKSISSEDVSSISSASPSLGRKGSFKSKSKKKSRKWNKGERPSISVVSTNSDEIEAGFMIPRTSSSAHEGMRHSSTPNISRPYSSRSGRSDNGDGDR